MDKLFSPVKESQDPLNRIVFICKDAIGVYVFKPANGFRSKHYPTEVDEAAVTCFNRQVSCGQVHAFYEENESPAPGEEYPPVKVTDPPGTAFTFVPRTTGPKKGFTKKGAKPAAAKPAAAVKK